MGFDDVCCAATAVAEAVPNAPFLSKESESTDVVDELLMVSEGDESMDDETTMYRPSVEMVV